MRYCFRFPTENNFLCLFFRSGLKLIFHWNAQLFIFAKSLFRSRAEVLLSWITENKDVSSTKSLAFEDNPDKSLIHIRNNNGQRMESWGTPALTSDQPGLVHLTKLFVLHFSKSHKRFSTLPDVPFCFNLKMRSSCQTLSNAFDISRKTPLTSSNDLCISWVIAKTWFMQESPGLNPDWLDEMSSFLIKHLNIWLKINSMMLEEQRLGKDK